MGRAHGEPGKKLANGLNPRAGRALEALMIRSFSGAARVKVDMPIRLD
jgi:hypothetical protein